MPGIFDLPRFVFLVSTIPRSFFLYFHFDTLSLINYFSYLFSVVTQTNTK